MKKNPYFNVMAVYNRLKSASVDDLQRWIDKAQKDIDDLLNKYCFKMTKREYYKLLNFYRAKLAVYQTFLDSKTLEEYN